MKHIIGLMAMLLPILCGAQSPPVKALTIGDTVPDIVFNNIINYKDSTARLSDFKGKLVILDFWGKYCGPCIRFLPELESLQELHKEQIQVITVSDFITKQDFFEAKERINTLKNLKIPVLLENEFLRKLFPHVIISHIVWIDGDRIIKAITGSDYVTNGNIKTILSSKKVNWPVKKDLLEFENNKPLLALSQKNLEHPDFIYYSSFTGYLDGVSPANGTDPDSINNVIRTGFYNMKLLSLCQIAVDNKVGAKRNQFVLNVKDTAKYVWDKRSYYSDWIKKNTFCYSVQLPIGLTTIERRRYIKNDLLRWLSIMGVYVKRVRTVENGTEVIKYFITERPETNTSSIL